LFQWHHERSNNKLNLWATQIAFCGCLIVLLLSIPTFFYIGGQNFAIYGCVVSVVIAPFMMPLKQMGPVLILVQQFYVNAFFLVGLSIALFFQPPLVLGGICWLFAAVIFVAAGITGEKGETVASLSNPQSARGGE